MRLVLRLASLLVLLAGLLAFGHPAVGAPDPTRDVAPVDAPAVTSLVVSPNTDLVDGQVVSVMGSGFNPGVSVAWCQAVEVEPPAASNCGSPIRFGTTDANGNFTGTLQLQRSMFVGSLGTTVDCANPPDACVVGAAETADVLGTVAIASLHFAPVATPGLGRSTEGDSGTSEVAVPLTLAGPSSETVTIDWSTILVPGESDFQAEPDVDYQPASGTVTFAPGETAKTVALAVGGDVDPELDEYVVVAFGNPAHAVTGGFWGLGVGVIENDD